MKQRMQKQRIDFYSLLASNYEGFKLPRGNNSRKRCWSPFFWVLCLGFQM